tara:strand:+ start:177 stop:383 length:207 start_codon:yes stop_codon:yes gene_type:complete
MKTIFITLLILTNSGTIEQDKFKIYTTCSSWFDVNVIKEENKKYSTSENRTYYVFNNKVVVGYICNES